MLLRFMHFAVNCTNGRKPKYPKLSWDMELFVKIILIVARALKAQHCNDPLKTTEKREIEKSDITKVCEKG
jgi:hypothetical protein